MPFSFSVPKPGNVKATIEALEAELVRIGGKLTGDENSGTFVTPYMVDGAYAQGEDSISVTITRIPSIAPESYVKAEFLALWDKFKVD